MTPDNTQLYNEKGNAGRYIVNKNIAKIGDLGLRNNIFSSNSQAESARYVIDKDGNIVERRKKRMCSLGGNEPKKQSHLVRLKTVGTFDLCMEVTALACGFNEKMLNDTVTIPPQPLPSLQQQLSLNYNDICNAELNSCSTSIPRIKHISMSVNSLTKLTDFEFKKQSQQSQSLCTSSYAINGNVTHFNELDLIKHKLITGDSIFTKINKKTSAVYKKYNTDTFLPHQRLYINDVDKNAIVTTSDDFAVHSESFDISKIRRRTFKKCNRIIRTDSELFKDTTPIYGDELCGKIDSSFEEMDGNSKDNLSNDDLYELKTMTSTEGESVRNISTDTVFSDTCDPVDLEKLENEYKEHIRASLQREYKSDGSIDSLDEVGKKRYQFGKWKNQSVDFNFLDDEDNDKDVCKESEAESQDVDMDVFDTSPVKLRQDDDNRTKSEGDYELEMEQRDSFDTQESTEEESDKFPNAKTRHDSDEIRSEEEPEQPQTLFEKRFGKFKKINKLLKVKRYSTSALYDKKKTDENNQNSRTKGSSNPSASPSKGNLSASKTSLSSPKSVQEKKNIFKKRKFSFFGKSQSNNDLNINLKSIASKISLLSKSNFDLSNKKLASNLKLNDVGIAGKYGASNEYRSDILVNEPTSPLNEGFYNPTGSYQLSAMELFEKFCSQDFTGLYKHEPGFEAQEEETVDSNDAGSWSYTGAIKKSISLRKSALMKQCSEPRFGLKNHHHMSDDYAYNREDAFEEELENQEYNDETIDVKLNHHNSYCLQTQNVFEEEEDYFEDNEDGEFFVNGLQTEPIYFQPELHRETIELHGAIEITGTDDSIEIYSAEIEHSKDYVQNEEVFSVYAVGPETDDIEYEGSQSEDGEDGGDDNLKTIISDYVKNALASGDQSGLTRTKSVELLSNSSDTIRSNSNSEYAFDTVKHLNLDSCNTSRLSLSLKSDIFDDVSFTLPLENNVKTIQICEMDDFTLTPDGSMSCSDNFTIDDQGVVKNELNSQYTIIDYDDELRHDDEEKSSFAEALNKEFDKLFSRVDESDTDVTTPSCTTIVTAVKIPSRCSMEKLEPYSTDAISDDNVKSDKIINRENTKLMSQSMTSTIPLEQLLIQKKDDFAGKSKRSHSLGNIHKRKSNKCNPL